MASTPAVLLAAAGAAVVLGVSWAVGSRVLLVVAGLQGQDLDLVCVMTRCGGSCWRLSRSSWLHGQSSGRQGTVCRLAGRN
jgi:hypothetical protein